MRARIVLRASEGLTTTAIAQETHVCIQTASKWWRKFDERGLGGLLDEPRRRHQELLRFLKRIDDAVPATPDVHLILDNYATNKHAKVRAWLAARPRFHLHFTPTYSSWLNQIECWFGLITRQTIRRSSFKSVKN